MASATKDLSLDDKPLEVYYMKMTEANCDARLGKLQPGDIRPMDEDKARRYLIARVAVQVTEGEYKEQQDRKLTRASAQQEAFRAINDGHALWDVSTYRDVLTAPESGLRQAFDAGIPLVNVHMLRTEDGDTLPPDADIEDILDAAALLHPDLRAPLAAHDRSSVMGGGSPYATPAPLSPRHQAMMERIAEQEQYAQRPAEFSYTADDEGAESRRQGKSPRQRNERTSRAVRRAGRVSPAGKAEAAKHDLKEPEAAKGDQVGN